jgi:hypothetical protein
MSDTRTKAALKVLFNMKIPYGAWNDALFVSDFSRKLNRELDRNTPRTDEATYPADCLGKTLVVNRDCAAALETELAAANKEIERFDSNLDDARQEIINIKNINRCLRAGILEENQKASE